MGHMMQLSLTDELSIGHMHSLPSAVFQTIKATFKHCKVYLAHKRWNDAELTSEGKNVIIVATHFVNSCISLCSTSFHLSYTRLNENYFVEPIVLVGHNFYEDLASSPTGITKVIGSFPSRNSENLLSFFLHPLPNNSHHIWHI